MIPKSICRHLAALSLFIFFFMGCASHSPSATYYLLTPIENPAVTKEAPADGGPVRLGVGPVVFPKYLKRPQMVSQQEGSQMAIAEFDRWAEPLADNFTRVLTENLGRLLNTDLVYPYPYKSKTRIDYHILIDIYRFNAAPGPKAELIASWTLLSGKDRSLVHKKKFELSKKLSSGDASETVSALNAILSDLSLEIADAIKSLTAGTELQPASSHARMEQADSPPAAGSEAAILQSWQGDFPVRQLDVLPEEQQDQAVGFIVDAETFGSVWAGFKPNEDLPDIDFQANLVLFSRNTQFYNRLSIARVNLNNGVAEVLSMETMSALPIEDKVAFSMAVISREGVKGIKGGDGIIQIPEF